MNHMPTAQQSTGYDAIFTKCKPRVTDEDGIFDAERVKVGRHVQYEGRKVAASSTVVPVGNGAVPQSHERRIFLCVGVPTEENDI